MAKILKKAEYIKAISDIKYKKNKDSYLYHKLISKKNLSNEAVNFFKDIVCRMQIQFEEAEARIIKENDNREENNFMFFIERGECMV